jgi:hypothetical protein
VVFSYVLFYNAILSILIIFSPRHSFTGTRKPLAKDQGHAGKVKKYCQSSKEESKRKKGGEKEKLPQ